MITKNCIICLCPAKVYTGHVLKGKQKITAGWCRKHISKSEDVANMKEGQPGCFGEYKPEFGILQRLEPNVVVMLCPTCNSVETKKHYSGNKCKKCNTVFWA